MQRYVARYYQKDALNAAVTYMRNGGTAGLAILPTGTGKSHIIADLIQQLFLHNKKNRILMLTHVKELIEQNFEKLKEHWEDPPRRPPAGINSAGLNSRQFTQPIIYAGIQSVFRHYKKFGNISYLLIDECHLLSDKSEGMYRKFINGLKEKNPHLYIIGFTATPYRMDMGHLCEGKTFDSVFYDISSGKDFIRLIDENYLSDLKGILPKDKLDISLVKKTQNDFVESSLDEHINRSEITKKIVAETSQFIKDRNKGLAFCVSKSHAEDMSFRFEQVGISSTFIHSDLSGEERAKRLKDFKEGKIALLTNVGVLTTGFDAPDIDYIVMARPTRSPSLHVQMLGRGMRPHANKENCLVLDYGGNMQRLGLVNDISAPQPISNSEDIAKVKICPLCKALVSLSSNECRFCNTTFVKKQKDIYPNSHVYQGEVIKKPSVKLKKTQSINTNTQHPIQINVQYSKGNTVLFRCSQITKKNPTHMGLIFVIFKEPADYIKVANLLSQIKTPHLHKIIKSLEANWQISSLKNIELNKKPWKEIRIKISNLPSDKIIMLLLKYDHYLLETKNRNKQIISERTNGYNRFTKYVFTHSQSDCPLQKGGRCLFVVSSVNKKNWICTSCKTLTNNKEILGAFQKSKPNIQAVNLFNFVKGSINS